MKRAAGLVIFRKLNVIEYLLLQTSYGENHWTPPKGHVDDGESDWETALRETFEEAGFKESDLEIHKDVNYKLNYNVNNKPKVVVYWLARLKDPSQKVVLSDEHQDYKWIEIDEAKKLSGHQDASKMFDVLHTHASKL